MQKDLPNYFSINYILQQWGKAAGVEKKVSFHIARHTFATSLLTKGADIYTTSKLLGHQNLRTTQIYADVVDSKKKSAVVLGEPGFLSTLIGEDKYKYSSITFALPLVRLALAKATIDDLWHIVEKDFFGSASKVSQGIFEAADKG